MFADKYYTKAPTQFRSLYAFIRDIPCELRFEIISLINVPEVTQQFYIHTNDVRIRRGLNRDLCHIIIDFPSLDSPLSNPARMSNNHIYLSTKSTDPLEVFSDLFEFTSFESENHIILRNNQSSSSLATIYAMNNIQNFEKYDEDGYEAAQHEDNTVKEVLRSTSGHTQSFKSQLKLIDGTSKRQFELVKAKLWQRLANTGNLRSNILIEVHNFSRLTQTSERYARFKQLMELLGIYMGHYTEPVDTTKKYYFASYKVKVDNKLPKMRTTAHPIPHPVYLGLNFVGIDTYNQ
ncbi:hypothetical protein WICPIJ_007835 [Wickerhamomyces pijperi]|uniref:Uncharacterized protein n=1 Tax=Wickerhamomyces pijperi TaxID=599730 RepID=A0A9P8TJR5_WICPI|nr:hypothetical protein WICPIJ_007835 [Wickerhamomyces pijperi]